MKTKLLLLLSVVFVANTVSFATSDDQEHFYGMWMTIRNNDKNKKDTTYITISEDKIGNASIMRWESERNWDSESNASYPDGYKIRCENKEGKPFSIILWGHSKSDDKILVQHSDQSGYFMELSQAFQYDGWVELYNRIERSD